MSVPVKKVRQFLKKQHAETLAVKRKHIRKGLAPVAVHTKALADRLDDWSDDDGNLDPLKAKDARRWAAGTAMALGLTTAAAIRSGSEDAVTLATKHANQWSDFAADAFDDDFDVDDNSDFSIDDDRVDDLHASYLGNPKRGVFASLMKVASAVAAGLALSDFGSSIGADSDDETDVAEQVMSPVASRTEMYIRTETGDTYGLALENAVGDEKMGKRWATIDSGCDEICHPADGQVQDMDDDFEMGDGSSCDYPPAHPNCDCTWLPWKDDWGSMKSTDDIEDDTAQAA